MSMHSPPHPGSIVRENLDALDLSVAKAASALGVTRSQLYRVLKGESAISAEMALRLSAVIGLTADHWLRLQNAHDLARLRNSDRDPSRGLKRLQVAAE